MYVHLIEWKWKYFTTEPGTARGILYDAIFPTESIHGDCPPHVYAPIQDMLAKHRARNPFRWHLHCNHMASSQVAAINLFLPILNSDDVSEILRNLPGAPSDFATVDRTRLDNGFCLEYWGGNFDETPSKGLLGDKSKHAGTDADFAIAYLNQSGQPCLWLIEHKFLEPEFTTCGGMRSKGRTNKHRCDLDWSVLLQDPSTCYYHEHCGYKYWHITKRHQTQLNTSGQPSCPFAQGCNQLWRNQVLAWAIEESESHSFQSVHFSVLHHPDNHALDSSLTEYQNLLKKSVRFSRLTSRALVESVQTTKSSELAKWAQWYKELYRL